MPASRLDRCNVPFEHYRFGDGRGASRGSQLSPISGRPTRWIPAQAAAALAHETRDGSSRHRPTQALLRQAAGKAAPALPDLIMLVAQLRGARTALARRAEHA